ncbi:protein ELC-like [Tasmannia lanceolata]|uniref:protein ELC-like n=1 Tax=Tasmannia lanceolata TaxID=3420 RepID=UPI0040627C61
MPSAQSPQNTLQFLTNALSQRGPYALPYTENLKWHIRNHLMALLDSYPTLQVQISTFTHKDSRTLNLLQIEGTIPMDYQGLTYNIPLLIWLIETYPRDPPHVYVNPTPDMIIKHAHPFVNPSGFVSSPYLYNWLFPSSNLLDLVRHLSQIFSRDPPLYTKHPSSNPNPNLDDLHDLSSTSSSDRYYFSSTSSSDRHHLSSTSSSDRLLIPPNPHPSLANRHSNPNPSLADYHSNPNPNLNPNLSDHHPYPNPNPNLADHHPYPNPNLADHHPYPNPNLADHHPYPNPNPNFADHHPYANHPPRVYSSSPYGNRFPPSPQRPMDDPLEIYRWNAIHTLQEKVNSDITALRRSREAEMYGLFNMQGALRRREEELNQGLREMMDEKEGLEHQLQIVLMNVDVLEGWVRDNEGRISNKGNLEIDDVFEPCDALSNQMLDSTAADLAIEDLIYSLDKAVRGGSIPFDLYLKNIRLLSREQFFSRAMAAKVRAAQMQAQVSSMAVRASQYGV